MRLVGFAFYVSDNEAQLRALVLLVRVSFVLLSGFEFGLRHLSFFVFKLAFMILV